MALQLWLPLNGNVENQGSLNVSPQLVGGGTWENGKVGKCYNGGGNGSINLNSSITINSEFCIALWLKVNSFNGAWNRVFAFSNGNNEYVGMCYSNANTIGFHIYDYINESKKQIYDKYNYIPALGEWAHIAIVLDKTNTLKWYKNGELLYTDSNVPTFLGDTYTYCMLCSRENNLQRADCSINDFRFYDTALSPREIKEISKGLVLHYPLSREGFGADNYVNNSNVSITTGSNTKMRTTSSLPEGTVVTASCRVDADNVVWNENATASYRRVGMEIDGFAKTAGGSQYVGAWAGETLSNGANVCEAFTGSFHGIVSKTVTLLGTMPANHLVGIYIQGVKSGTVKVSHPKLEVGDKLTPWTPATTDSLYSAMGLDSNVVYDVSGFGNNATKVGTISTSGDTPRYFTSSSFDGSSYIINNTSTIHLSNEFTIAWWGKFNTWRKKWEGMFLLQNTKALDAAQGTYSIAATISATTADIMTLTIRQGGSTYPFDHYNWTYSIGEWTHYAFTYNKGMITMYQNGKSVYTNTITDSNSMDYYYVIGKTLQNCDCQMSDFRIYNTALSLEDIQSLYHTPISLSNNGTLLTQGELQE